MIWVYPILWLFWPAEAYCSKSHKKRSDLHASIVSTDNKTDNYKWDQADDMRSEASDEDPKETIQTFM